MRFILGISAKQVHSKLEIEWNEMKMRELFKQFIIDVVYLNKVWYIYLNKEPASQLGTVPVRIVSHGISQSVSSDLNKLFFLDIIFII